MAEILLFPIQELPEPTISVNPHDKLPILNGGLKTTLLLPKRMSVEEVSEEAKRHPYVFDVRYVLPIRQRVKGSNIDPNSPGAA